MSGSRPRLAIRGGTTSSGSAEAGRVRARYPDIGRIVPTGQADADAVRRAWEEAKVCQVIHKPWSEDVLRRAIKSALPPS